MPEHLHRAELVDYPGPWSFTIPKSHVIFVSDEQLVHLTDPDRIVNTSLSFEPREESLRQICEQAQAAGSRTLILAFDHFFGQYRPGQGDRPRALTPDKDEYIAHVAKISRFISEYGLALELSLLSPLEIGPGYVGETGEPGVWMHYRKGQRDPKSGRFSVQLWRQIRWANNKGTLMLQDAGVRVFAFREQAIPGTPYRVVAPADIVEVTDVAHVEIWRDRVEHAGEYRATRIRVHGEGRTDVGPLDRVLVVQHYHTPEMDYFSENALPYLTNLIDRYIDAGVRLNALYSDEMHIQQDWHYTNHFENGGFPFRYVSPGLQRRFAELYGGEYRDLARYMVYFTYGQEDTANDLSAKDGIMHVLGDSPTAIHETALFRSRYYRLLQDGVVELFVAAKRHLEHRMGYQIESRAHATWAESPTIDQWSVGPDNEYAHKYEYTSSFRCSNTVHQAASACHDYFKWGEFLVGTGNDTAECGWLDRNYWGLTLAHSIGIINEIPNAYAAHWGMPDEISRRRMALVNASGAAARPEYGMVQHMQHRVVDVLMLYPLDLVAMEDRFGSWMTQYGYANLITQAKLLEHGTVVDGTVEIAGYRFSTLMATFEPFPSSSLLSMMMDLAQQGGRVIWSGIPPVLLSDQTPAQDMWQQLTGARYNPTAHHGRPAPGRVIRFHDQLANVSPMVVLTDFLVDRIYALDPMPGTSTVATMMDAPVGVSRLTAHGGSVTTLGFRPRDDQSRSMGHDVRTLFEILTALGAYPPTGRFAGVNDNTEYLSRNSDYFVCRFPNGAVAVAPHLREVEESWEGGFARNEEADKAVIEQLMLPSNDVVLQNVQMNGHLVTYTGRDAMSFLVERSQLIAFAGVQCNEVTIDGVTVRFAEYPMESVAWAPVQPERRGDAGALVQIFVRGFGDVSIPVPSVPADATLVVEGTKLGSRGEIVDAEIDSGFLTFTSTESTSGRWLFVVP